MFGFSPLSASVTRHAVRDQGGRAVYYRDRAGFHTIKADDADMLRC